MVKTLRPTVKRFSLALTLAISLLIASVMIFIAVSAAFVLREPDVFSVLLISFAAASAIVGLRLALDIALKLIAGETTPLALTSVSAERPDFLDQTQRMDELMRLNTQLASVNRDLAQANEKIERLDRVKTDFITIASHELRTPLAQMRGYTDIIDALNEGGALDPEKLGGLASNLRRAAERMEELIGAMLDTSQIDVDALDLRYTPTTIETVIRMAIDPLSDAVRERKIMLRATGLSGLPTLQGDMQRLVQAFRNVIVNAVKFTPDGGRIDIKGDLAPATGNMPEMLHIIIKDNGVGIASENLDLIFHKFYRAYDPSRHSTGSYKFMGAGPGLGLTIARGIIDGHGGRIWAESPGHDMTTCPGAAFHITLPLTPPEDARSIAPFGTDEEALPDEATPESLPAVDTAPGETPKLAADNTKDTAETRVVKAPEDPNTPSETDATS